MNFAKYIVLFLVKFKSFMKQTLFLNSPARKLQNDISLVCFLRVWFLSTFPKSGLNGPISRKSLVKS